MCLKNASALHSQPSSPANGSAEWPPDDRLRRAIQYSEEPMMESKGRGLLDTRLRGYDVSSATAQRAKHTQANVAPTLPSPDNSIITWSPALSHTVLTRLPVSTNSPARRALPSEAR